MPPEAPRKARPPFHFNTSAPLRVWVRLLREHGLPAPEYRPQLARILLFSALLGPWRLADRLLYAARVARTPIHPSPVFILGAARSGTTFLHGLMGCDPGFGFLTHRQALAPGIFLSAAGLLQRLRDRMARGRTVKRSMDNVEITPHVPQEEEVAISNLTHRSFMHCFSFPQSLRFLLHRYATLEAMSRRELAHWDRLYLMTLRKATWAAGGRRLVLKSPTNMARLPHLLRLFPEARFVHIVRNPYTIYHSMTGLFTKLTDAYKLQTVTREQAQGHAEDFYIWCMRKYLEDRHLIAADRLVEVRYEDLERNPLDELERIYRGLELPDWEAARAAVESHLAGKAQYRKNVYPEDPAVIDRVNEIWRFAVDEWQYRPPDTQV